MDLFRLFRRRPPPAPAAPAWVGPPDATPIHAWLDASGFPWRETRGELARRFGEGPDPAYEWNVVPVATDPPVLEGLVRPLTAKAWGWTSPCVPAVEFTGVVHVGEDAGENIRRTIGQLEPHLGAVGLMREHNTLAAAWTFGPASLRLQAWPRKLQSGAYINDAERRDPRLATGCHVRIETGWRLELSAAERALLEGFRPILPPTPFSDANGGQRPGWEIRGRAASDYGLEYVRLLPPEYDFLVSQVGLSDDGAALIVCRSQLMIVPMTAVVRLEVGQMRPGRGFGYESLNAVCRVAGRDGVTIDVGLASQSYAGDMDVLGRQTADRLGLPLEIVDNGVDA